MIIVYLNTILYYNINIERENKKREKENENKKGSL